MVTGPFRAAPPFLSLRFKGLDPNLRYQVNGEGSWPGDILMQAGFPLPTLRGDGDYRAFQFHLKAE